MTIGEGGFDFWAGAAALVAAAALSAGLIVLLRPWLLRYALARPNARSSHRKPTPQGGGIAVIAATILVTAGGLALFGYPGWAVAQQVSLVLAAAAFIAIVGGIDDVHPLPIVPRLLLQALAAIAAIAVLPADMRVLPSVPWWLERLGFLLALLWFVNLVNFMDGIDWMTVAEVVPLSASLVLLGVMAKLPAPATVMALALLGGMLGFAPFNKPVARLFLGDVGSLSIGLLLGWLLLRLAQAGEGAAALLLPLYYLADASVTLARRLLAGEPFWQAHRSHFYQRAGDIGFSVGEIVARVFLTNVALAALAFLTVASHAPTVIVGSLLAGSALIAWLLLHFSRKRVLER
ncbi:MAG TPA: glycosyl transferase [Xanthobacteraceae bacterium]|nr:glycosyl transferase [Xanthobacteraceae bacterium]